ncbi:zinc metallopeptidase [Deinococcus hopiensis]|uniref:Zinc metallopeptidase n=1 Tax=Deinococcus hopiensis KR-140 TaxID=695939 RepID=A0A1W1UCI7_9DEIO|nr:zinc metallopeptidase [Deinococcus hopiensis]SMB78787.1 hypothetical protein SAMN00790413_05634 [Deinococcus hopiensis KR-140]
MYSTLILLLLLSAVALQFALKSTVKKHLKTLGPRPETGAQVARTLLDRQGLPHVTVEETSSKLSDHYDPRGKVVRLSADIYHGQGVAAQAIAAHECGHAAQDAEAMALLRLRGQLALPLSAASWLAPLMVMVGVMVHFTALYWLGALIFAALLAFHLITLPVEFDASRRALTALHQLRYLDGRNVGGARRVLGMAAMTYVIAALMAFVQLLQILTRR